MCELKCPKMYIMGNCFSEDNINKNVKYTALHHAVKTNNIDEARHLLWTGCTVYDKDSNGESVYKLCKREGSREMKNILCIL